MAELSRKQILEQDIDWYCLVNGVPTHFASMGGMIPKSFRDRKKLRKLQDKVAMMPPTVEAQLNIESVQDFVAEGYEYLQDRIIREVVVDVIRDNPCFQYLHEYELPIRLFASSFVEKARRGFRSYARKESAEGNEYVLIANPTQAVEFLQQDLQLEDIECTAFEEGMRIIIPTEI